MTPPAALSQALANVNVKCDFVSVPTHPTITKLRVLSRNQQLIRLDFEEGFSGVDPQPMHERIQQALGSIGALVLSDYAKRGADQRPDHDPTRT
ncbi:ADP-heptose synthase [Klebsiella pneumoniae subsp. ozaenae]|uniref:ADP-heptose synthase n=1 Tax=Klebsiella pneumoniae subsp. ozaenae TaxID=574 RepID=A0A377Z1E9_KLEPO|nr:ADP-heptose synthase [Klebsiella pneumoniae subsp. ozaenae]